MISGVHMLLVITIFIAFGMGLEGPRNAAHEALWWLLQPAVSVARWTTLTPGQQLALLPLNSAVWGFGCALALSGLGRLAQRAAGVSQPRE